MVFSFCYPRCCGAALVFQCGSGSSMLGLTGSGFGSISGSRVFMSKNCRRWLSFFRYCSHQYCGSMTFWYGFGSADSCLFPMDPDPDASIFVIDLQDANEKLICKKSFWKYGTFTSQSSRNEGFSYNFCLMIDGPETFGSDGS